MKRLFCKIAIVIAFSTITVFPAHAVTVGEVVQKTSSSYTAQNKSVYGPSLTQEELDAVASVVTDFLNTRITDDMSRDKRIRVAHDYLVENINYASDWRVGKANTAYGAFINHSAQCSGYSRAFKALCDGMGIPCYYVHADQHAWNPSHQWNIVEFSDGFYHIDVQANDSSGFDAFYHSDTFPMSYDSSQMPTIGSRSDAY